MYGKIKIIAVLVSVFAITLSGVCFADDLEQDGLCRRWKDQHRQQVIILIQAYLRSEPAPIQHRVMKETVRLEALLGTCSTDNKDFYMDRVNPDNLEQIPGQILMVYLVYKGIRMDARSFFEGKRFRYFVREL